MTLPYPTPCCLPDCDDPTLVMIPGPGGGTGGTATDGEDGQSAWTTLTDGFVMPDENTAIEGGVVVGNSDWMTVGQVLVINGSYFYVQDVPDSTHVVIQNLEDGSGAYASNAPSGTAFAAGLRVVAGGQQGIPGEATAGSLLSANNLSDVENPATARANLGITIADPGISSGNGPPNGSTTGSAYIDNIGDGTNPDLWLKANGTWRNTLQIPVA